MDSSLGGIVYADLDHDVTDGFGPETDTIHTALSGTYQFLVNDYTDEFTASLGSSPLAASGATVNVYTSAGLMATFYVPNLPGTLWYVFDLDGASLTLTPVNTMSFDQPDAYPSVLPVVAATRGGLVSAPAEASEVAATRAVAPRVPKAAARKAVNVKPAFIMP